MQVMDMVCFLLAKSFMIMNHEHCSALCFGLLEFMVSGLSRKNKSAINGCLASSYVLFQSELNMVSQAAFLAFHYHIHASTVQKWGSIT